MIDHYCRKLENIGNGAEKCNFFHHYLQPKVPDRPEKRYKYSRKLFLPFLEVYAILYHCIALFKFSTLTVNLGFEFLFATLKNCMNSSVIFKSVLKCFEIRNNIKETIFKKISKIFLPGNRRSPLKGLFNLFSSSKLENRSAETVRILNR